MYIEAQINNKLVKLLKSTPGLVHRFPDVSCSQIDFEDWTKVLTMTDHSAKPSVDSWVRVHSGLYKGDIGFLMGVETWGGVSVLLIPRLPPPYDETKASGKRKQLSSRPILTLFNPTFLPTCMPGSLCIEMMDIITSSVPDFNVVSFTRNTTFTPSLLLLRYQSRHSIFFQDSCHPQLTMFPCPVEWVFEEGDEVMVISSQNQGIVHQVQVLFAEVDLHNGEGLVNVPWSDLYKVFAI